jgi:hypothetical protein
MLALVTRFVTFSGRSQSMLSLRAAIIGQEQRRGSYAGGSLRVTVAPRPPRREHIRRSLVPWVVWGLWLLEIAGGIFAFLLFTLPNQALAPAEKAASLVDPIPFLVFATVGAVIVSRRPGNVIGWLCCAIGFGLSFSVFGSNDARTALVADPDRLPAGLILYGLGELGFVLSLGLLFTFVLLLFPTGRLPSRRWQPVAWTAGVALAAIAIGTMFQPGPMGPGLPANPVGIKATGEALGLLQGVAAALIAVLVPTALASLAVRFHRARGDSASSSSGLGSAGPCWSLARCSLWSPNGSRCRS